MGMSEIGKVRTPLLKALHLKRFLSIPAETIEFGNPTFIVGKNGSGKSNFMEAIAFLSDAMTLPLESVFDQRGGITSVRNKTSGRGYPPNLAIGVHLGRVVQGVTEARYAFEIKALPNYGFEVIREQCILWTGGDSVHWFDRNKGVFSSNQGGIAPYMEGSTLLLPRFGGRFAPVVRTLSRMRTYSIAPGALREMQDPDPGLSLKRDGSNAAAVLQRIERESEADFDAILESLTEIVPCTTKVKTIKHGNKLSLRFTQQIDDDRALTFESFNMSDGTLRALGLLIAAYQHPLPSVLAIEEPEATMHPGALGAILDVIKQASKRTQVVVTTHSPEVLDAEWIEEKHLRTAVWHDGATSIRPVSEGNRRLLAAHLMSAGDLLRTDSLQPDPIFRDPREFEGRLFLEGL